VGKTVTRTQGHRDISSRADGKTEIVVVVSGPSADPKENTKGIRARMAVEVIRHKSSGGVGARGDRQRQRWQTGEMLRLVDRSVGLDCAKAGCAASQVAAAGRACSSCRGRLKRMVGRIQWS